jgi:myo-inositol-1(or 4)-monophosphatase
LVELPQAKPCLGLFLLLDSFRKIIGVRLGRFSETAGDICNSKDIHLKKEDLLQVAVDSAKEAGAMLLAEWAIPREITTKGFRDYVTDADFAAQTLIVNNILANFPDHGFVAEEEDGELPAFGTFRWVIDPVDGTTNYSRHLSAFCVSIGVVDNNNQSVVGVIYDPVRDELFSAIRGQGSHCNGKPLQVSHPAKLIHSIVSFDWSHDPDARQHILNAINTIAPQVRTMRAMGSAALALAYVAAGRLEGYFNFGLKAWDAAAGSLILREAGGKMANLAGEDWALFDTGCLASNQPLANFLRESVSSVN